jgi:hypothetical protein
MARALPSRFLASTLLLLLIAASAPVLAQEEERQLVTAQEIEPYLGHWVLRMTSDRGEFDAELDVQNEAGEIRASLNMGPLGRQSVETIFKTEEGIDFRFEADLGGQRFKMKMPTALENDQLVGTVGDTGGFLSLDFRGITEAKAQELERAGERRRIRIRRGAQTTQRTELQFDDAEVVIRFDTAKTDEPAFAQITALDEGVVRFLQHQSTKLFTDIDLKFGDVLVRTENVTPDYPGVYSLWLRKAADGWQLLFNDKADVWGHQHDPETDSAAVPVEFRSDASPEAETFTVELAETTDGGGSLRIAWGPYVWTTGFSLE